QASWGVTRVSETSANSGEASIAPAKVSRSRWSAKRATWTTTVRPPGRRNGIGSRDSSRGGAGTVAAGRTIGGGADGRGIAAGVGWLGGAGGRATTVARG